MVRKAAAKVVPIGSKRKPRAKPKRPLEPPRPLSVLEGFERLVESIRRSGEPLDTAFDAREALGRRLARMLDGEGLDEQDDDGERKGRSRLTESYAGLSKEYRAVVAELVSEVARDPDDDTFASVLPAKVRNPPQP
jgi:hypothetical protein